MKIADLTPAVVLLLGAAATASAQAPQITVPDTTSAAASAPAAVAPSAPAPTNDQLVEEFGWFIAKRVGVADLQFTPAEVQALLKGVGEAVNGQESPYPLQTIGPAMDAYMQQKQGEYLAKLKTQNQAAAAAYFAKLKDDKTIVQSPSGLYYKVLVQGDGPGPKPTDTVRVNYTGRLLDGTVFDTSLQPRQAGGVAEPAELSLGNTIAGWTEGLQKIGKGGKIMLYIPANLAYGDEPRQSIPPGSALIFEVDLLDINPAPASTQPPMPGGQ